MQLGGGDTSTAPISLASAADLRRNYKAQTSAEQPRSEDTRGFFRQRPAAANKQLCVFQITVPQPPLKWVLNFPRPAQRQQEIILKLVLSK